MKSEEIENLVDCLYRFVEMQLALQEIMKDFYSEPRSTTLAFESLENMVNQNTKKTYNLSRDREKLTTVAERAEEENNKTWHKKKAQKLNTNRISWFHDQMAYVQLGEKVMKMVGLLQKFETCEENNYLPADIARRNSNLKITEDISRNNSTSTRFLLS